MQFDDLEFVLPTKPGIIVHFVSNRSQSLCVNDTNFKLRCSQQCHSSEPRPGDVGYGAQIQAPVCSVEDEGYADSKETRIERKVGVHHVDAAFENRFNGVDISCNICYDNLDDDCGGETKGSGVFQVTALPQILMLCWFSRFS